VTVPPYVQKVFNSARPPVSPEERLWRERAARMTLDALGQTNLTTKHVRHNEAVKYARRWFRGVYEDHPNVKETDSPTATFDAGGLIGFKQIRDAVLAIEPHLYPEKDAPLEEETE
jgi:hypothetical protein